RNASAQVARSSQSNGGWPDREPILKGMPRWASRAATRRPVFPVPPSTSVILVCLLFINFLHNMSNAHICKSDKPSYSGSQVAVYGGPMPNPALEVSAVAEDQSSLRRMPSQRRSRERVERILECATALIGERGSDAMRMSDVAEMAGISIGSLYQ